MINGKARRVGSPAVPEAFRASHINPEEWRATRPSCCLLSPCTPYILPTSRPKRSRKKNHVDTHISSSILVWSGEGDRDLDVATCKAELVPRLNHAGSVLQVVVFSGSERSSRAYGNGELSAIPQGPKPTTDLDLVCSVLLQLSRW